MTFKRALGVSVFAGVVGFASVSLAQSPAGMGTTATAEARKIGPYEALVFDKSMLSDVKVDASGNVFLLLQPNKIGAQITMRISMEKGAAYRKWSTGEEVWHSQQNAPDGRKAGVWSDRIQTSANYIEYWAEGRRFLWLKKSMP